MSICALISGASLRSSQSGISLCGGGLPFVPVGGEGEFLQTQFAVKCGGLAVFGTVGCTEGDGLAVKQAFELGLPAAGALQAEAAAELGVEA